MAALLLVFTIATFPSEGLDRDLPAIPLLRPTVALNGAAHTGFSFHVWLVAGPIDEVVRRPTSWFSDRLVLPGLDVVDHAKFETEEKINAVSELLSMRGRHLEQAVLHGARLRKVDFTGAQLQGADLRGADLREANLGCDVRGGNANPGVYSFGATLACTQLQGAHLSGARLQGAVLRGANLLGADLDRAKLQGADLRSARMQLTTLADAQLQGAVLSSALLTGADLRAADLRGAALLSTDLQGVSLAGADFTGASLVNVSVWRTPMAQLKDQAHMRVESPQLTPSDRTRPCAAGQSCVAWTATTLSRLRNSVIEELALSMRRQFLLSNLLILDPSPDPSRDDASEWQHASETAPSPAEFAMLREAALFDAGCTAPAVLRSFITFGRLLAFSGETGPHLATRFLDSAHCLASRGLSDDDRALLIALGGQLPEAK
jgi:uncharacterized protein YjbI with pentapeptide repeats